MTTNGASSHIISEFHHIDRDRHTSMPPPTGSPREKNSQQIPHVVIPLQERPILGPPRPNEEANNASPNDVVTLILNVSRKFYMCIIFSTGYIKIYNINSSNEYFIQQHAFIQSTIQYYTSKVYKIHP